MIPSHLIAHLASAADAAIDNVLRVGARGQAMPSGEVGFVAAVVLGGVCALYGVPVVWGLVAVFVAERGDQPTAAWAALAAAAVVAAASIMAAIRRRPAPA